MDLKSYDVAALECVKDLKIEGKEISALYSSLEKESQRCCHADTIKLPLIVINRNKLEFGKNNIIGNYTIITYEIEIATLFETDMNSIIEQLIEKHKRSYSFKIVDLVKDKTVSNKQLTVLKYKGHIEIKVML